jgi:microcystin-dependent protein
MAIRTIVSATNTQWYQSSNAVVPVGTIMAYLPGYFTASNNTGFTSGFASTIAMINSKINPMGYKVCDGSSYANSESPNEFFPNGVTRYLPNLTGERFLQGSNTFASSREGGSNSKILSLNELPQHNHYFWHKHTGNTSYLGAHSHSIDSSGDDGWNYGRLTETDRSRRRTSTSTNSAGNHSHSVEVGGPLNSVFVSDPYTQNSGLSQSWDLRPQYLHVFYIMKVY